MSDPIGKLRALMRSGTAQIGLDDLVFVLSEERRIPVNLPAHIEIKGSKLHLWLRKSKATPIPSEILPLIAGAKDSTTIEPKDCYSIEAQTSEAVVVKLIGVHPLPSSSVPKQMVQSSTVAHFDIDFYKLELTPAGTDALDSAGLNTLFEELRMRSNKPPLAADAKTKSPAYDELFALIPNVELKTKNSGLTVVTTHPFFSQSGSSSDSRCLVGKLAGGEYCLEATDEGDLAVRFRREARAAIDGPSAREVLAGMLVAVGLLHSCNPWPFYLEHRSDHRIVERWVKAPDNCQRDCLEPMSLGPFEKDAEGLFCTAALFFAAQNDDAQHISRALWLMREGNSKGLALEVRLLTLCSVLEGIAKRYTPSGQRIQCEAQWKLAMANADVPWDQWFASVHSSYKEYRNDLAHGFDPSLNDQKSSNFIFNAYSRITAAIYILMARRMGFKGELWRSRLEGRATIRLA
jgi:hypothetical protein